MAGNEAMIRIYNGSEKVCNPNPSSKSTAVQASKIMNNETFEQCKAAPIQKKISPPAIDIKESAKENDIENVEPYKLHWNDGSTKLLISLYKEFENEFKKGTRKHDAIWKDIASTLTLNGQKITWIQAQNKWKHLRKLYMKQIDNMGPNSTRAEAYTFEYFEEMNDIFQMKHSVHPLAKASSSRGTDFDITAKKQCAKKPRMNKRQNADQDQSPPAKKKNLMDWLHSQTQEKENNARERHEEFMQVQKESIKVFSTTMEENLEKL